MSTTRPFFDTAREIRRGEFLDECADGLKQVVDAVNDTGKSAKLVIELTVKPASKGQGAVIVSDKITPKLPALPAGETVLFATPEGNLQAKDPRQGDLTFQSVPSSLANTSADSFKSVANG